MAKNPRPQNNTEDNSSIKRNTKANDPSVVTRPASKGMRNITPVNPAPSKKKPER